jgi:hypothetical protein
LFVDGSAPLTIKGSELPLYYELLSGIWASGKKNVKFYAINVKNQLYQYIVRCKMAKNKTG